MHRLKIPGATPIFIASSLLLLLLLLSVPMAEVGAHAKLPVRIQQATRVSVQGSPIVDPTVTTLEKEQLQHENDWFWNFGLTLLVALAALGAGIFGIVGWFADRQAERKKQRDEQTHVREDRQVESERRAEGRFQSAVEGLGSEKPAAQLGAAIMLRTFLQRDYEQFYRQAYDLATGSLRLRAADKEVLRSLEKLNTLDPLSQALSTLFKESFPLARNSLKKHTLFRSEYLDATGILLDKTFLYQADLEEAWLQEASLRKAYLSQANLRGAHLKKAHLQETDLAGADLAGADLTGAHLTRAVLKDAILTGADLRGANLTQAVLKDAQSLKNIKLGNAPALPQDRLKDDVEKGAEGAFTLDTVTVQINYQPLESDMSE